MPRGNEPPLGILTGEPDQNRRVNLLTLNTQQTFYAARRMLLG